MKLSQELLEAADEDARARVVVRWLPNFARCQVKTAARVKQLVAKIEELSRKMDTYHNPKAVDMKPIDPRLERLRLILGFIQRNWPAAALLAILVQVFGLGDLLKELVSAYFGK